MERCASCQNILPRTVDRCPVCGKVVATAETPAPIEAKGGPGWAESESTSRSSSGVPAPELKPRKPEGPRTVHRKAPEDVDDTRKVLAASSRIEANVQIGPTAKHKAYTVTASVLAVLALVAGAVLGYPGEEVALVPTDLPTPSTLPLTDTNDFLIDAEGVAVVAHPSIVQLTVSDCGVRTRSHGFVTENSVVVTSRDVVLGDVAPVATTSDGELIQLRVIGWNRELDIAVLEADDPLPKGLVWGSSRRLKIQGEVAIVEAFSNQTTGRSARISDVTTRDGQVESFGLEDISFRAGAPGLNEFAAVVGVVNVQGRLIPAEDVRELIGEYRVNPMNVSDNCS